jgi:hypothetical protein
MDDPLAVRRDETCIAALKAVRPRLGTASLGRSRTTVSPTVWVTMRVGVKAVGPVRRWPACPGRSGDRLCRWSWRILATTVRGEQKRPQHRKSTSISHIAPPLTEWPISPAGLTFEPPVYSMTGKSSSAQCGRRQEAGEMALLQTLRDEGAMRGHVAAFHCKRGWIDVVP